MAQGSLACEESPTELVRTGNPLRREKGKLWLLVLDDNKVACAWQWVLATRACRILMPQAWFQGSIPVRFQINTTASPLKGLRAHSLLIDTHGGATEMYISALLHCLLTPCCNYFVAPSDSDVVIIIGEFIDRNVAVRNGRSSARVQSLTFRGNGSITCNRLMRYRTVEK